MKRFVLSATLLLVTLCVPAQGDEKKRLNRALDWPLVDLSRYDRLFVEDCEVTDPEAPERKIQDLVRTVPGRFADFIGYGIDRDVFEEVHRRSPKKNEDGLILRVELTRYRPGSQVGRSLMVGASSANLHIIVHLIDTASGEEIHSFSEERDFNWGGFIGGRSITLMEERAGAEIAAYLMLAKGMTPDDVLAKLRLPYEGDGPPEVPHGTIYILRPQGAVGAAARFRVGVDDVTAGESRRNTYHVIYVTPGEHKVWQGGDKRRKEKPVMVEAGKSYYFQAMGGAQMPEQKGKKKLEQCRLVRRIDLTDR